MRIASSVCFTVVLAAGAASTFGAEKPETSRVAFVTEFIRELTAIENIRASAQEEQKDAKENENFPNAIHASTRFQLELRSQIGMLKSMHFNDPFDTLIPNLISFYKGKIELYQKLIDISTSFIEVPKPGVDYGKLAAELPKIRAGLEYIDESVFKATPMVFSILIDLKADSKNHVSHLIITRAERAKLVDNLTRSFGAKLDQNNPNFTVGAASVLKEALLQGHKCSDEPWE